MAVIDRTTVDTTEPGWFPDPTGDHKLRYFDGRAWTEHVTHFGPMPCAGCGHREVADSSN